MEELAVAGQVKKSNGIFPAFPVKLDIYKYIETKNFRETSEGQKANADWTAASDRATLVKRGIWVLTGLTFIVFNFLTSAGLFTSFFYALLVYVIGIIPNKILRSMENKAADKFFEAKWNHTLHLTDEILNKYLGGRAYSFYDGRVLFYSDKNCVYSDCDTGETVAYDKSNIKEVMLEHVHLGSTTTGTSTSKTKGSINESLLSSSNFRMFNQKSTTTTTSVSNTKDHYEWRLDIMTSFIEHPKLSLIFPDSKEGEEAVKTIYAILRP